MKSVNIWVESYLTWDLRGIIILSESFSRMALYAATDLMLRVSMHITRESACIRYSFNNNRLGLILFTNNALTKSHVKISSSVIIYHHGWDSNLIFLYSIMDHKIIHFMQFSTYEKNMSFDLKMIIVETNI